MPGRLIQRGFGVRDDEIAAAAWSCAYFFFVLCGYYVLRPLREEMGLAGGVGNLPWLFLGTLGAMLAATPVFGALVSRFPRRVFLPAVYRFFGANLLIFYALLWLAPRYLPASADIHIGRVFYVWVSVFNLFAVSIFWAFMADGFVFARSKRLFGFIAVGGSLGAIGGSSITAALVEVEWIGRAGLLLVSVAMLEAAVQCAQRVAIEFQKSPTVELETEKPESEPRRGGALAGIGQTFSSPYLLGIAAYIFLFTLLGTFLYFQQGWIVDQAFADDREAKTVMFARIDLWSNVLTLAAQLFLTGRIMSRLGVGVALAMLPVICLLGFAALAWAPVLAVLVVFQVLRRAMNYGISKPARETLYTVVSRDEKYKAKSFIDTFVYRGSDALGAGVYAVITGNAVGLSIAGVAVAAIPLAVVWVAVSFLLGNKQRRLAAERCDESQLHGLSGKGHTTRAEITT